LPQNENCTVLLERFFHKLHPLVKMRGGFLDLIWMLLAQNIIYQVTNEKEILLLTIVNYCAYACYATWSIVMSPHSNHFYDLLFLKHLVNKSVLNVDTSGVRPL